MTSTLSRRAFLTTAGIGATSLALAACSSTDQVIRPTPAVDRSAQDKFVRWDNRNSYANVHGAGNYPQIDEFQRASGIQVRYYPTVDDDNVYFNKIKKQLALGQDIGTDLTVVTSWMASKLIRFGYAQEFDHAAMPNLANLDPSLKDVSFDAGRAFSIPARSGFTGIAWNKDKLPGGLSSVSELWDPALKGKVGTLSNMRDTIGLIMQEQGVDISADWGDAEFSAAVAELRSHVVSGQVHSIKGNSYKKDLQSGETVAAIVLSGDVPQLNAESGDHWDFAIPDAGGVLWTDCYVIPIGSPHKASAQALVDFYYSPAVAAGVVPFVKYMQPVVGTKEALDPSNADLADDQFVFPGEATRSKVHEFRQLSTAEEQRYGAEYQTVLLGA